MRKDSGKIVMVLSLILGLLFMMETCLWSGLRGRMTELEERCRIEKQQLQEASAYVRSHPDPEKPLQEIRNQLKLFNQLLPAQPETAAFAAYLEQAAIAGGVRLVSLRPATTTVKQGLQATPVELVLQGKYFSSLTFLRKLEETTRQINVSSFDVKNREDTLEMHLTVLIYSLHSEYK